MTSFPPWERQRHTSCWVLLGIQELTCLFFSFLSYSYHFYSRRLENFQSYFLMLSLGSGKDSGQLQGYPWLDQDLRQLQGYPMLLSPRSSPAAVRMWLSKLHTLGSQSAKSYGSGLWKWAIEIRWVHKVPLMEPLVLQERPKSFALTHLWCPLSGRRPSPATTILVFPAPRNMSQINCVFLHYPIFVVLSATENGPSQLSKSDPMCLLCKSLQPTEVATCGKAINLKVPTLCLQSDYTLSCQIAGRVIFP